MARPLACLPRGVAPLNNAAIGIFDSGVGGLTVFSQVAARMPGEDIVYLGDTARVPYGTKSADTVVRYARACAGVLLRREIKALVVACNTASAFAMEALREELSVPVVGVVEPGARAAVARSARGRIGVIGTAGTVASGAYPRAIKAIAPEAEVFCAACPLFVPLAEEGWLSGPVPETVAGTYLAGLLDLGIDTLVLGCTHYPLLANVIQKAVGSGVALVDSAEETAREVATMLEARGLGSGRDSGGAHHFLASDAPVNLARAGERFLGHALNDVEWVDF